MSDPATLLKELQASNRNLLLVWNDILQGRREQRLQDVAHLVDFLMVAGFDLAELEGDMLGMLTDSRRLLGMVGSVAAQSHQLLTHTAKYLEQTQQVRPAQLPEGVIDIASAREARDAQ